jgi:PEP-CTERM motif
MILNLHAIGFGVSETWDDMIVSGTNWTGSDAIAANGGSGVGLISAGGDHVASGTMSARLSDGLLQEVVMSPSIVLGTRKSLTQLDAAFLRDIGFLTNVTAVPEPGSIAFIGLSFAGLAFVRRRRAMQVH